MRQHHYLHTQLNRFALLLLTSVLFTGSAENEGSIDYFGQKPPGLTAELFAPGLISTDSFEHSAPAFSPDGSVVLWTVVDRSYRASMLEMEYTNGHWSAPHQPSFADSTAPMIIIRHFLLMGKSYTSAHEEKYQVAIL